MAMRLLVLALILIFASQTDAQDRNPRCPSGHVYCQGAGLCCPGQQTHYCTGYRGSNPTYQEWRRASPYRVFCVSPQTDEHYFAPGRQLRNLRTVLTLALRRQGEAASSRLVVNGRGLLPGARPKSGTTPIDI